MHNSDLDVQRTLSNTTQYGDAGEPSKEGLLSLVPRVTLGDLQLGLEKIAEESSELDEDGLDHDVVGGDEHGDAVESVSGKVTIRSGGVSEEGSYR